MKNPIASPAIISVSVCCFRMCTASCITIAANTYDIAAAGDMYPSCIAVAVASAPTSAACELGIPPNCQNAVVFLLIAILVSCAASQAIAMLSRMFIFLFVVIQDKNFLIRQAGIEPALNAWEAFVIPLDHWRAFCFFLFRLIYSSS